MKMEEKLEKFIKMEENWRKLKNGGKLHKIKKKWRKIWRKLKKWEIVEN